MAGARDAAEEAEAAGSSPADANDALVSAASLAAADNGRTTAEQLAHWARIGCELEASRSIDHDAVAAVLAGDASYDDLPTGEQAIVRAVWSERIAARLQDVDLVGEFRALGRSWVELGADGVAIEVRGGGQR